MQKPTVPAFENLFDSRLGESVRRAEAREAAID